MDGIEPRDAVQAFSRLRGPSVSSGGVNIVLAFGARMCARSRGRVRLRN
jgi:hypothetical protein